jgi:hypothetical protein
MKLFYRFSACCLVAILPASLSAQVITVQNGATVNVQSGASVRVTGTNIVSLENSGTVNSSGVINMSGDLENIASGQINLNSGSQTFVRGNYTNDNNVNAAAGSEVIFNGTGVQTITQRGPLSTQWKFYNLRLNGSAGMKLDMQTDLEIANNGTLNFNNQTVGNIIQTNAGNFVEMGQNATLTGIVDPAGPNDPQNYSYVDGHFRWLVSSAQTKYDFPLGKQGGGMMQGGQKMHLDFGTDISAQITRLEAIYDDNPIGLPNPIAACGSQASDPVVGYTGTWEYFAFNGATPVTNLTGGRRYGVGTYPRNVDISGATTGTSIIRHTGDADYRYVQLNGAVLLVNAANEKCQIGPGINYTALENLNQFSSVKSVKAPASSPFPVEMLSFRAIPLIESIQLDWTTAQERNAKSFDIERSLDGTNFVTIASGIPAMNRTSINQYAHEDRNVEFNVPYLYRIKQIDNDGKFQYSVVREAMLVKNGSYFVGIYPNPTRNQLSLTTVLPTEAKIGLTLYDVAGRLVAESTVEGVEGLNQFDLSNLIVQLSGGTYTLSVRALNNINLQHYEKLVVLSN